MKPSITLVRFSPPAPDRPLLLLGPSLGTSAETLWGRCARELHDSFEILAWELPGHGRGAATTDEFTVAELAEGILTELPDGRPFVYAGDSIGGAVGLQLLLDHAARVAAAVLACTGARIGTADSWHERAAVVRASGTLVMVDSSARRWFGPGFLAREPEAATRLLEALADTDAESYALTCEALARFDVTGRLDEIRSDLTLIGGTHDVATPLASLREIAAAVAGARLVELDIAHLAPVEDPMTVAALIAATSNRVATSSTAAQSYDAGMAVRRAVAGDAWVDRAIADTTDFTRDFQAFITQYAWGSVWTRPGLDRRSRSLITLTALVARGHHDELRMHLRGALNNGLTCDEIREALLHTAIYCGVPDANAAFRVAADLFAEIDAGDP